MKVVQKEIDVDTQRHARRAVIASTVGSMIEWYDFYIYGLVAATVLGKLFFPQAKPTLRLSSVSSHSSISAGGIFTTS